VAITALSRRLGLGLSSFVAIGNRADVTGNDLLEYWEEDARTRVILFYLESFGNPRRFARLARRVGRTKPIVAVKASRTTAGRRSVDAHDESVAWANLAVDALFSQTGVIRADTLEEMFGIARALADQPLPRGRRVAILTNAGGPAILCADALIGSGMRVEPLGRETRRQLAGMLPPTASTTNPVDMLASCRPEVYRRAVEVLLSAEEVDALVVIHTPVGLCETSEVGLAVMAGVESARALSRGACKPVVASIVGEEPGCVTLEGADGLRIPVYPFPEAVGRLMSKVADYAEWRRADPGVFPEYRDQRLGRVRQRCQQLLERNGPSWMGSADVRMVLASSGLVEAPGGVARSATAAVRLAEEIGFPVVLKLASDQIVNKADQGGVRLGIGSSAEVRSAFTAIRERFADRWQDQGVEGVLVQPMLFASAEVTIRVSDDPRFGPLISFSLAGMHWEVLGDAAHRVSPLTDVDARTWMRGA
jgi:acyl-CoA synthetase (NDP forming)